jgi:hypothetical protein
LNGSIAANSYYIIKEYSYSATGSDLPVTPNVTGTINLATSGGKIALVSYQTAIVNKSDSHVIDFVGYGSSNESETSAATSPSNTSSIRRMDNSGGDTYGSNGSGYDSDNNNSDFYEESSLSTNGPLPVELTSFVENVTNHRVNLYWATATEVNNYGFDVERKSENADWMKIGFVEGNGNSNSPKSYSFTDEPKGGREFKYRLKQIDLDGSYEYSDVVTSLLENVSEFVLDQNFPNPFNPVTRISYTLPERASVRLKVYDMLAKEVSELVNSYQEAGRYEVTFDGSSLSSGTYFYKLEAGSFVEVKKLVLIK